MNVKIQDLMTPDVITAQPHDTVAQLISKMAKCSLSSIPVVSLDNKPVGIVSAKDLLAAEKQSVAVSDIMSAKVYTIPEYEDVSIAARMMHNHKIHHLVVTQEKKVVGVISAFDLLKLVEDHRFVSKNAPTATTKVKGKRAKAEG